MFWLKSVIFRLVKISGLFWLNSVVFNIGAPLPVDPYGDEHPFLLLQMPLPPPVPIETPGAVGAWNVAELITIWVFPLVRHLKNIPF